MNKISRLLPLWLGIAAVIIIAGSVLMGILGFNNSVTYPETKTLEVDYDIVMTLGETSEEELHKLCEETFAANGLTVLDTKVTSTTTGGSIEYIFSANADSAKLAAAKATIENALAKEDGVFADSETYVTVHATSATSFTTPLWRGAIGLVVGGFVALAYLTVRYGWAKGVAGLIVTCISPLVSVCVLAIFRIPVFGYTPVILALVGLLLTLVFWMMQCAKLKETEKNPAYAALSNEEKIGVAMKACKLPIAVIGGLSAFVCLLLFALTFSGAGVFFLTALIPVAVSVCSAFLLMPAAYAPVKNAMDKAAAKRARYDHVK